MGTRKTAFKGSNAQILCLRELLQKNGFNSIFFLPKSTELTADATFHLTKTIYELQATCFGAPLVHTSQTQDDYNLAAMIHPRRNSPKS